MLRTALKPRWIAALLLALVVATVFVLLSRWQFSVSRSAAPPPTSETEQVQPLASVLHPGETLYGNEADQVVSFTGQFRPDQQVLIPDRLQNGASGWWVVTALAVDGEPGGTIMPVVRGWVEHPGDAQASPAATGPVTVEGRLLPPEAPLPGRVPEGTVRSLSPAELINVWDSPGYAAFVIAFHVTASGSEVGAAAGAGPLQAVWVGPQPQQTPINWLNVFYGIEWVAFAGFAFFLWWRMVADDYRRSLEDEEDAEWHDDEAHEEADAIPTNEVTR